MADIKPPKPFSSKSSSKSDPLKTALEIADMRSKTSKDRLAPHDYNLIGPVAGQLAEGFKGKKNKFSQLTSGLFQGVQNAAQFSKLFEDDKRFREHDKILKFFEEANLEKMKQQQYHDKMENAQRELQPSLLAYAQNINKTDPQTAHLSGEQMWDDYTRLTGATGKFMGWAPMNPFVATIKDNGQIKLLDIRPLFGGDPYVKNEMATLSQDYQNRLQEQRLDNERKNALEERKYALEDRKVRSIEGLNAKKSDLYNAQINELNPPPLPTKEDGSLADELPLKRMGEKFSAGWQEEALKEINQIRVNRRSIETVDEMRDVFNEYPDIGSSYLNMIVNNGDVDSWATVMGRKLANEEELAAVQKLKKFTSDLNLSTVLGVPGKSATDLLKQTIQASSPSGLLTYEAFNKIADTVEKRANENIKRARLIEEGLARGMYLRNLDEKSMSPKKTVVVQQPDGTMEEISQEEYDRLFPNG